MLPEGLEKFIPFRVSPEQYTVSITTTDPACLFLLLALKGQCFTSLDLTRLPSLLGSD